MRTYVLMLAVLIASATTSLQAQEKSKFNLQNMVFGGSFGFNVSNGITAINISPQVGYRFNQYLTAGVGLGYTYYSYKTVYSGKIKENMVGANIYGQVNPIRYASIKIQPEIYHSWGQNYNSRTISCLLVGAGANLPMGGKSAMTVMLYYDVAQNEFSPYGEDVFYSVGYTFSF